jgi:hypothetical protein
MLHVRNALRRKPPRIKIDAKMLKRLETLYPGFSTSDLADRCGLPYGLLYNIVNNRVGSVSARHYRILFKEAPPRQANAKVDGGYFRKMVDLWLYLDGTMSKAALYANLCPQDGNKKPDYRIFSGQIDTIDARLEDAMEQKFIDCGFDRPTLQQWIREHGRLAPEGRVAYSDLKPILRYLNRVVGIHPTALLSQLVDRYESGELKTVTRSIYERAAALKQRAEVAFDHQDRQEIERIKEAVYGKKQGYIRYSTVEAELKFLQRYGRKSPKGYLGRGLHTYEKGVCKRIASWRAEKIIGDCGALIDRRPDLPLSVLPQSFQHKRVRRLQTVLLGRAAELLSREDGIALEKKILSPSLTRGEYTQYDSSFTQFDRAPSTLGMKKRAFDLMVAKHCDIFKMVGRYAKRWYLSDLYLKELSENAYFNVVTTKYERMAQTAQEAGSIDPCVL